MGLTAAGPPLTGSTQKHTRASPPQSTGLRAYTTECARAHEIADPARIPIVGPKTRRVGPTGRTPGGSLATPQNLT